MKKLIATISIITALGIGAFALNSVLPAGAVGSSPTQATDPSAAPSPGCHAPGDKLKGVLDKLVADGKISQDQEDTILQAVKDARASAAADKKPGRTGARVKVLDGMIDVAAGKIGVSADELKAALQSGQSVADVATAHSVNPSDVVTAIVDAGTTKLADAVTNGNLTQEKADKVKNHLPQAAAKFVNHKKPAC